MRKLSILSDNCYFLVPNKKVTKEVGIGEALNALLSVALRAGLMPGCALHAPAGAAAIQAALLKNPPDRIAVGSGAP